MTVANPAVHPSGEAGSRDADPGLLVTSSTPSDNHMQTKGHAVNASVDERAGDSSPDPRLSLTSETDLTRSQARRTEEPGGNVSRHNNTMTTSDSPNAGRTIDVPGNPLWDRLDDKLPSRKASAFKYYAQSGRSGQRIPGETNRGPGFVFGKARRQTSRLTCTTGSNHAPLARPKGLVRQNGLQRPHRPPGPANRLVC